MAEPLLAGEIRSAFSMTEPRWPPAMRATSRPTIVRDGDDYVINGRKWWTSGAADPRCKILIVMGRTNPDAASHQQQSMILVPSTPRECTIVRSTPVFGWQDQHGHAEIVYDNVRVPAATCWARRAAASRSPRRGSVPGRIHHCMRALGVAERALALMVDRVNNRIAFGKPLAEQGMVQKPIAMSRNEIDQARLLCRRPHGRSTSRATRRRTAGVADQGRGAAMACDVIDRAIQVHGAAGVSDDTPLARMYGWHRAMRIFDGPDEVHLRTIARAEIGGEKSAFAAAVTLE